MNKSLEIKLKNLLSYENIDCKNLKFLAGDASNRKYFNIDVSFKKYLLMYDDNTDSLNNFIKVSNILSKLVSIPRIIFNLKNKNILIIEDFGLNKFSQLLQKNNRTKLYKLAVDALIQIHKKNKPYNLEFYDIKKFTCESDLFFDWFISKGKNTNQNLKKEFNTLFKPLIKITDEIPKFFVHRDYHVDNLFFLSDRNKHFRCGWIDYQDALIGPCVYDLVSLTQDARIDVSPELEIKLINYYLDNFKNIDKDMFNFSYKIIAIQRHLKVLGIFTRLYARDKKKIYLTHIPRVISLLKKNLQDKIFRKISKIINPLIKSYD